MPDTQIHPTGTVSTPADYVIPTGAELILKGAYAHFDGTSAAGSFVPLLRIISNAGSVSLEAVADTTVAAGASADVTWFPRLAAASSSSTGAALNWAYIGGTATKVCTAGANTVLPANTTKFYTNDSSVFTTGVDGSGNHGIVLNSNGHYLSTFTAQPFGVPTAGSLIELITLGGGAASGFEGPPTNALNTSGTVSDEWRLVEQVIFTVGGSVPAPAPAITAEIDNYGTHDVTMIINGNYVIQLDTSGTDI